MQNKLLIEFERKGIRAIKNNNIGNLDKLLEDMIKGD